MGGWMDGWKINYKHCLKNKSNTKQSQVKTILQELKIPKRPYYQILSVKINK